MRYRNGYFCVDVRLTFKSSHKRVQRIRHVRGLREQGLLMERP